MPQYLSIDEIVSPPSRTLEKQVAGPLKRLLETCDDSERLSPLDAAGIFNNMFTEYVKR